MHVHKALITGIRRLQSAKDHRDSAILDAELLLAHVLGVERAALYTHPERVLTARESAHLRVLLQRRARHEPVAYILGEKEFYGLRLAVTPDVLIPRPETEALVEAVIGLLKNSPLEKRGPEGSYPKRITLPLPPFSREEAIIEVGTGSGAIAVALATRLPASVSIVATDVSRRALAVARANARRHGVADRIKFVRCDLVPPHLYPPPPGGRNEERVLIVANLPYLPTALWQKTTPEIKKYEPRLALDGGKDGLDVYRRLLDVLPERATLIAELLPTQMRQFAKDVKRRFPKAEITPFHPPYFKGEMSGASPPYGKGELEGVTIIHVIPALKRTS